LIGTCLDDAALRRILPRYRAIDRAQASELDVHHTAVELAAERGEGAKAIHKALDDRYAGALARWRAWSDSASLAAAWTEALASGEVSPAYWALMTHPAADESLRSRAFGDVHMLSHRIGSANRADVRRLAALERENEELQRRLERHMQRLQEACHERDAAIEEARAARAAKVAGDTPRCATAVEPTFAERREDVVARLTARRDAAERATAAALLDNERLQAELAKAYADAATLHTEVIALEAVVRERAECDAAPEPSPWQGRRVLYVGGRPSSNGVIRRLAIEAGVDFTCHDGGVEDRKGLLPAALPHCDLVLFPVDCVDHESMTRLKRLCARHDVPWRALRTASVASALAALRASPRPGADLGCRRQR
jgi:hypothetical protein